MNPSGAPFDTVRRPVPTGLARARLEDPLLPVDGPRLTLVCAPAGSGKSTLLSAVAARTPLPVAWYRATVNDGVAGGFVRRLAATLARDLRRPDLAGIGHVDSLLAALDRQPTSACLLILDDLHEISGTSAEPALARLLAGRPSTMRVILGSRRLPELNLPWLRAAGELHEIGADDLRFRVWEVEELFALVHREPLSPETAATLTRRTGGWAAGLQLFHLATAHKSGLARQQAVTQLSARTRLIRSYLARNVLDHLTPERRAFLVDTCALGLLDGAMCDELLGRTGSADILEELERDQLFTVSTDDGLTFRYHEVLQRHLELELVVRRGVEGARQWHTRCAAILRRAGAFTDALRAYALAEDWRSVAELVQCNGAEVTAAISTGRDGLLPLALLRDDPWLAVAEARRQLRRGAVQRAIDGFRHAEALLDEPRVAAAIAAERRAAARWLPAAQPGNETSAGPLDELRTLTRHVQAVRPKDPLARAADALLRSDFATASARFADLVLASDEATLTVLAAQLGGVLADLASGELSDTAERLEELAVTADAAGYPWLERVARGVHAMTLAVAGGTPWRLAACAELLVECAREGDDWGAAVLQLGTAIAGALMHDPAAEERFADARARFIALDAGVLAGWADILARRCLPTAGPPSEASLAVRCFGGFAVEVAGKPLDLGGLRPRALSLLRLLAMQHGRPLHRERLVHMLWPDASLPVGTRRLQVAVSSIRRALPGGEVERVGDSYRLSLPDAEVDVTTFEQVVVDAQRESDLEARIALRRQALHTYRGELFPEEGAAEHVVDERERLRMLAAGTGCALSADLLAAGRPAEAADAARRAIELDRYQDAAWQLLVQALLRTGDDSAAARARLEHRRIQDELEDELAGDLSSR